MADPTRDAYPEIVEETVLRAPGFARAVFRGARRGGDVPWSRVVVRPVDLDDGEQLQFVFQEGTQSITRNYARSQAGEALADLVAHPFANIHLETAEASVHIGFSRKGRPLVRRARPSSPGREVDRAHNRAKARRLSAEDGDPLLAALGVTGEDGRVRPGKARKYKQINEFVEHLAASRSLGDIAGPIRMADLGCGAADLSFAAYHELAKEPEREVSLVGVDQQAHLVERNNAIAAGLGWDAVSFEAGLIAGFEPAERPNVVLALHACDTATDDALARAVQWAAPLILAVPCCHHELQARLAGLADGPPAFETIRRQGILRERMGDIVTDAFRIAILGALGYKVTALEFVSPEHTPRNVLLRAERAGGNPQRARAELQSLGEFWNVTPRLAELLADELAAAGATATGP